MKTVFFQMLMKSFEVKADVVVIEWYASTKDLDRHGDVVEASAWTDEEAMKHFSANPVLLLGHNQEDAIGVVTSWSNDEKGLYVTAEVRNDINNVKQNIIDWTTRAFSIGFAPLATTYKTRDGRRLEDLTETELEDISYKDIIRSITKLELVEISVVNVPANPATLFTLSKSLKAYFDELATKALITKSLESTEEEFVEEVESDEVEVEHEDETETDEDIDEEEEVQGEIPWEEGESDSVVEDAPVADEEEADPEIQKSDEEVEVKQAALDAVLEQKMKELADVEKKLAELKEKVRTTPVEMARVNAWVEKKAKQATETVTSFFNPNLMN